jgi:hypothetical protein
VDRPDVLAIEHSQSGVDSSRKRVEGAARQLHIGMLKRYVTIGSNKQRGISGAGHAEDFELMVTRVPQPEQSAKCLSGFVVFAAVVSCLIDRIGTGVRERWIAAWYRR